MSPTPAMPGRRPETQTGGGSGGSGVGPPGDGPGASSDPDGPDRFTAWLLALRDAMSRNRRNAAPYVDRRRAEAAAEDRERFIDVWRGDGLLFEAPPNFIDDLPSEGPRRTTEAALARWQSQARELLLLARAADAILAVLSAEAERSERELRDIVNEANAVVSITPLPRILRRLRPGLFPWRVDVRTTNPYLFMRTVPDLAGWLGIGVDVVRGDSVRAIADGCAAPSSRTGTIAGLIESPTGEARPVTCSHVLGSPSHCVCADWRVLLPRNGGISDEPDAALLGMENHCFSMPLEPSTPRPCADIEDMRNLVLSRDPVRRIGTSRGGRIGRVNLGPSSATLSSHAALAWPNGVGGMSRFPVVDISPRASTWRRLLNLGAVPFAVPGDSGSWVIDEATGKWIGMVAVAEQTTGGHAYALSAQHLTDHLATDGMCDQREGRTWWT